MKYTVSLLALASLVSGGCQSHGHDLDPHFDPGSTRTSIAIGINVKEIKGAGFASPGAMLESDISLAESAGLTFTGSYGTFLTESVEMGAQISMGQNTTDFNVDDDPFHPPNFTAGGATLASEENMSFSGSAYTRYYLSTAGPFLYWVQGNLGYGFPGVKYVLPDGFMTAESIGMTYFMNDIHALELGAQLAQTWGEDTTSAFDIFFGYSVFH